MRCRWGAAVVLMVAVRASVARAGPTDGEARSIVRDGDRVYTTVAGEADGAATVTNPANLGFLRGVNGILDLAWTRADARRRGNAIGAMLGIPLPWQILSIGFGYQFLRPRTAGLDPGGDNQPQNPDDSYSKVTLALAVPMMRWIKNPWVQRLSLGINYSRLVSSQNFHASGVNQVDLGVAWWPLRFVALGFVARAVNVPHTGPDKSVTQSYVIEPELAFRPLGTPALELAAGVRLTPRVPDGARWRTHFADPRGRLIVSIRGVRLFAEAERFQFFPDVKPASSATPRDAVKVIAGFGLDFQYFGVAAGINSAAGASSQFAVDGGVVRLRASQERYESVVNVRPRLVTRLALSDYAGDRGMWKLIGEIDDLAERRGVALVETAGMQFSFAQLEEIREALLRLRNRGGKVVAYLEGGTLRTYFIAATADRVFAHPNKALDIVGMRVQSFYFADLLAKLGAKAEFVRIAEYKGTPETYERSAASQPVARQRRQLVSDTWNHVLRTIARDRGQDPMVVKDWIDNAPLTPAQAMREGLIDALVFPDELDARLEAEFDRQIRIEKPAMPKQHAAMFGPGPRIAVVTIEGEIIDGESFTIPLLGRSVAGAATLTKTIERLGQDDAVRAVVVRCNTPGGSVSASDDIARELDLLRRVKKKPVVVSMGSACASGGYYIASAGQYIYADASTVTGSIGIFYPKFDLSGVADKLGIDIDREPFGARALMRSTWKPYSEDERTAVLGSLQASYDVFTQRVIRARRMSVKQVDAVARGRVWSGVRAAEIGLVDEYGGLREAVQRARLIAGLRADEGEVILVPPPRGLLANIRAILGFKLPLPGGEASDGDAGVDALAQGLKLAVPIPVLRALRLLPVNLWFTDEPRMLALGEESFELLD